MTWFVLATRRHRRRCLAPALLAVWVAGPAGGETPSVAAAGEAAPTLRIVSVGGSVTETIFALGSGAAVVGVDTSSVYPAAVDRLPKVGYARRLSAEGVLSLAPTQVIVSGEAGPAEALQQIRDAGVELSIVADEASVDGAHSEITSLAALLGKEERGRELIAQLDAELRAARASVAAAAAPPPGVLFVYARGAGTLAVAGRGTAAETMIELAGGRNAVGGFDGFKPLTPEAVVAAQPDVILMLSRGVESIGGIDDLLSMPGIAETPAARARRVVVMDDLYLLGFGPRLGRAVADLGRELRGGARAAR